MAEHTLPDDTIDDTDDNPNTEHHADLRDEEEDEVNGDPGDAET